MGIALPIPVNPSPTFPGLEPKTSTEYFLISLLMN
uniref:Uncharacterized protein n=1 Tax=Rhizophora mucronata TaxID=61149 RepID=A0A2P2P3R3_RHIMU